MLNKNTLNYAPAVAVVAAMSLLVVIALFKLDEGATTLRQEIEQQKQEVRELKNTVDSIQRRLSSPAGVRVGGDTINPVGGDTPVGGTKPSETASAVASVSRESKGVSEGYSQFIRMAQLDSPRPVCERMFRESTECGGAGSDTAQSQ